jgi:hypothetical protein
MLSVGRLLEGAIRSSCLNGCGCGYFESKQTEQIDGKSAKGGANCTICR